MVVALFDGRCVICQGTRRTIKALDWLNRVEFLDLHKHDEVEARFPELEHEAMMGEIHVVADDKLYAGFDGTRRMLKEVPLGFPVWLLLHIPGMNWLGPKIYQFVAKNRYAVNRFFGVDLAADDACEDGFCKIPQKTR
jgi:predicted DCC family thiol-disulfide oxidoreductase YuxK